MREKVDILTEAGNYSFIYRDADDLRNRPMAPQCTYILRK